MNLLFAETTRDDFKFIYVKLRRNLRRRTWQVCTSTSRPRPPHPDTDLNPTYCPAAVRPPLPRKT